MSTYSAIWGFHSNSQPVLISLIAQNPRLDWGTIKSAKLALWCREVNLLRNLIEKLARLEFQRTKNPMDAAIWFCILKKEKVLAGLFKSVKDFSQSLKNKQLFFYRQFEQIHHYRFVFTFSVKLNL